MNTSETVVMGEDLLYNASIQVRVRLDFGAIRLFLRQSNAGDYSATLDAGGMVNLYRSKELLGSAMVPATQSGQWRTFRFSAIENVLRVAVDGVEVGTMSDVSPLLSGQVGFHAEGENVFVLMVDDAVIAWQPSAFAEQADDAVHTATTTMTLPPLSPEITEEVTDFVVPTTDAPATEEITPEAVPMDDEPPSAALLLSYDWSHTFVFNSGLGMQGWTRDYGNLVSDGIQSVQTPNWYAQVQASFAIPSSSTVTNIAANSSASHNYGGKILTANGASALCGDWYNPNCNGNVQEISLSGSWSNTQLNITFGSGSNGAGGNGRIYSVTISGDGVNPFTYLTPTAVPTSAIQWSHTFTFNSNLGMQGWTRDYGDLVSNGIQSVQAPPVQNWYAQIHASFAIPAFSTVNIITANSSASHNYGGKILTANGASAPCGMWYNPNCNGDIGDISLSGSWSNTQLDIDFGSGSNALASGGRIYSVTLMGTGLNPFVATPTPTITYTPTLTFTPTFTPSATPTATVTPTMTPEVYACRVHPNVDATIYGYTTAEEAVSRSTTTAISFSTTDVLRVSYRASLYENVVRVERVSTPGTWYWIDSGIGVSRVDEEEDDCNGLPFDTNGMYAVRILTDGTRAWDEPGTTQYPDFGNPLFERQSIVTGLQQIGMAFDTLSLTANSPQDAFNRVMLESSGTEILLIRTQQSGVATVTITNYSYHYGNRAGQTASFSYPDPTISGDRVVQAGLCTSYQERVILPANILRPAAVICNGHLADNYDGTVPRFRASQYTIVHELGHIFDYRTLYGLSTPLGSGTYLLLDCDGEFVMQSITRLGRGWGTGPQQYMSGSVAIPLITNFQQNPANTAIETAADLFLNWVYRLNTSGAPADNSCSLTPRPPYNQWTGDGFLNLEWSVTPAAGFIANSQGTAGIPDPGLPGDVRYLDIDLRIRSLFSQFAWY